MGGKGVRQEPFDLDLWEIVGNWVLWGLFGGGILELRIWTYEKKLEIWIFGMGGYSGTSNLDLGKKVGNLDFWGGGGVFWNFGFGLRKKSWKFGFLGWGGILELRIWT